MTAMRYSDTPTAREHIARQILAEHDRNEWDGSADVETIAKARFAVIVEREYDSVVHAADSVAEVAGIAMSCHSGDGVDVEWVSTIIDCATGEPVAYQETITVRISIGDETATADNHGGLG